MDKGWVDRLPKKEKKKLLIALAKLFSTTYRLCELVEEWKEIEDLIKQFEESKVTNEA